MKFVLLAIALKFCSAQLYDFTTPIDWRNASYNISEFIQGFAYGAFEAELDDITGCANDTVDLVQTIQRDYAPIIEGSSIERAAAVSDLIFHMIRDIPDIIVSCGHVKNDTVDIITVVKVLFEDIQDFRKIARILFSEFGPALKLLTSSAIAIEQGNWYKGGLNLGKVFRIIASNSQKQQAAKLVSN